MKLSEPQKRVLGIMLKYGCEVYVTHGYAAYDGRCPVGTAWLQAITVDILMNAGLLECRRKRDPYWYRLTPKGREKAKELQDAETD